MIFKTTTGLLALALSAGAHAQVYKCVDRQGRVTFSQTPCAGQASEPVDVKIDKSRPPAARAPTATSREFDRVIERVRNGRPSPRPDQAERTNCKTFNDTELRTMIIQRRLVKGMKLDDALSAWGKPTRINGEQYVYHWPEASSYFYVGEDRCLWAVSGTFRGK